MGVRLWTIDGELNYRAPKGALNQYDLETLRVCKDEIVAFLAGGGARGGGSGQARQSGGRIDLAPLAFSQLAHWHSCELGQRRGYCVVGLVTRWRGQLDLLALQRALNEMIKRHDALRTRIVVCDGVPMQEIRDSAEHGLSVDDLTGLADSLREAELVRLIDKYMLDPVDVSVFPLYRFRLIRIREDDHILTSAMEHIIADGFSLNLLQGELLAVYRDSVQGRPLSLPPVLMQSSDYAVCQRSALNSWIEQHSSYWNERVYACGRVRFPADAHEPAGGCGDFGCVPFHIRADLAAELREWSRRRGTTVVMSFFVAYTALVMRWCNVSDAVILFQIYGRTDTTDRTVGYLASPLYLRIALLESDNFFDLLRRLTEEYCNAHEHADFSYMAAQLLPPDFVHNSRFNWLQQGSVDVRLGSDPLQQAVEVSRIPFEPRVMSGLNIDTEPMMGFAETDEEIVGYVQFPLGRFSATMMERLAHNFLLLLEALLRCPEDKVRDIVLD